MSKNIFHFGIKCFIAFSQRAHGFHMSFIFIFCKFHAFAVLQLILECFFIMSRECFTVGRCYIETEFDSIAIV
jgi:hypothetical protein